MANDFAAMEEYNNALICDLHSLEIRKKILEGDYHPEIAESYISLSNLYIIFEEY